MNVRPIRLLSAADLDRLSSTAQSVLSAWHAAWGMRAGAWALRCGLAHEIDAERPTQAGTWRGIALGDGARVWLRYPDSLRIQVEKALFAEGGTGSAVERQLSAPIAQDVAANALTDLIETMAAALASSSPAGHVESGLVPPPSDLFKPASGAVIVSAEIGNVAVQWLLDDSAHAGQRRRSPVPDATRTPLVPSAAAIGGLQAKVSVDVGHTEVTLGQLHALTVGDVIRLDTLLDQPLRVVGPDGGTLCHAHLGQCEGQLAVELVKSAKS